MPKKTKEKVEKVKEKSTTKPNKAKIASTKTAKKVATTKKVAAKKSVVKKENTKKESAKVTKKSEKVTKTPTKVASKKATSKNTKLTTTVAKTKKASTKKTTRKTTRKPASKKLVVASEYYDLPNSYEQTIVKILAQTPTILFVYWEISSKKANALKEKYGENFFEQTSPYLLVINKDKNYQFEVEINDYANSWYLHIPDSNCNYEVILMRKNKNSQVIAENSIAIMSSNDLETPNDHILFEKLGKTVFFKNVKNGTLTEKNIANFAFINNIGRIYNIYNLYKEIYKNELNGDELGVKLSSSQFSSTFK